MLKITTEEQKRRVEEILGRVYYSWPINWETDEDRADAIYLDGDITFDKMAAIVDYLREQNLTPFQRFAKNIGYSLEKLEGKNPFEVQEITFEQVEAALRSSWMERQSWLADFGKK